MRSMTTAEQSAFILVTSLLLVEGCGERGATKTVGTNTASAAATTAPAPRPPPPYGPGPWARASAGDVQAHRRLAELHDGARLGVWARSGPRAGIALEALVYAEDAELAYGTLADILDHQPERRAATLDVVYRLALRPKRQTEPLDPPGLKRLLEVVRKLATADPKGLVGKRARSVWSAFARADYVEAPP